MRRAAGSLGLLLLFAGRAGAHAFDSDAGGYELFLQGASAVLAYPDTLLTIVALGILLTLWQAEGLPRAWPAFLAGQAVAIVLPTAGVAIMPSLQIALGLVTAALAALLPRHVKPEALALACLTGFLTMAVSADGHGPFELPPLLRLGILLAANAVLAVTAGLARLAMENVAAVWMRIGWRVLASWTGAVLVLMLAFELSGGGS